MTRFAILTFCWLVSAVAQAETFKITGQVSRPEGAVVSGASVKLVHLRLPADEHPKTTTDSEGRFEFNEVAADYLSHLGLQVVSRDGQWCGMVDGHEWTANSGVVSLSVPLEESWNFYVKVLDAADKPVESAIATVQLLGVHELVNKTNADGRADFVLPRSKQVVFVAAFKHNTGFDFHAYVNAQVRGSGPAKVPLRYPAETAQLLRLSGAQQVEVLVQDSQGQPIAGASVNPRLFNSASESGSYSPQRYVAEQKTDANGKAVFDWIPNNVKVQYFSIAAGPGFVSELDWRKLGAEPVVYNLERGSRITGRVIDSEGHPKAGVRVEAHGATTKGEFSDDAVTDSDGHYKLTVKPNGVYLMGVVDASLVAPTREGIIVPRGKDIESIDFQLKKGTVLTGHMVDVATRQPVADQEVRLLVKGRSANAEELKLLDDPAGKLRKSEPQMIIGKTKTDDHGYYRLLTTPGEYSVRYTDQTKPATVAGALPVTLDLPAKIKKLDKFSGKVVDKRTGKVIVLANVYETNYGATWQVSSDEQGKFNVPRAMEATFMVAQTADFKMAGIAHVQQDQHQVVIECQPTATVTGQLVTADGRPVANRQLDCRLQVQVPDPPFALLLSQRVETNEQGEFTFKNLFADHQYFLLIDEKANAQKELAKFTLKADEQKKLGAIKP